MAYAVLTALGNANRNEQSTEASALFTAAGQGTAKYGVVIDASPRQDKIAILINATAKDEAVTIKAGNAKSFGAINDLVLTANANKFSVITLDTAKYAQLQDDAALASEAGVSSVKGKIVIQATAATTTFAVIKDSI